MHNLGISNVEGVEEVIENSSHAVSEVHQGNNNDAWVVQVDTGNDPHLEPGKYQAVVEFASKFDSTIGVSLPTKGLRTPAFLLSTVDAKLFSKISETVSRAAGTIRYFGEIFKIAPCSPVCNLIADLAADKVVSSGASPDPLPT